MGGGRDRGRHEVGECACVGNEVGECACVGHEVGECTCVGHAERGGV